jgi:uncharacterized protein
MRGAFNTKKRQLNYMPVDFKAKQLEFTRYIRNPETQPVPNDVKPERMEMYRDLMFNNIDGFLSSNFPVIKKILDDQQWFELAQDFFSSHRCKTPYFSEIAEEFLEYLENERDNEADFPFLLELAHYEWVEMALSISKEEVGFSRLQPDDSLLQSTIKLSPLAWPLVYQYPVQLIYPEFLPVAPQEQPVFLVAYRNEDEDVKFLEINPMTYRLLELIQEQGDILTEDCLKQVAEESQHPNPEVIIAGGLQILKDLAEKRVVQVAP